MRLGRRDFLITGSGVAGAGLLPAAQTVAAPMAVGRSVADFGVSPNSGADQTRALQKAIDQLTGAGEAVYIPGGAYVAGALELPAGSVVVGIPATTLIKSASGEPVFHARKGGAFSLFGLTFEGVAITGEDVDGVINAVAFRSAKGAAVKLERCRTVTVSHCRFEECAGAALDISADGATDHGAILNGNHFSNCGVGISLRGSGNVIGNFLAGAAESGLRLGGGSETGVISAMGNTIKDCEIGIGVAAGGETMMVSLNLIAGARNGAIRAFDGEKLVGPDLALESAESYLNLTIVGNVAR